MLPQPGSTFGRYLMRDKLGRGGMGVVFAAVHTDLDRDVAIKLLSPELADDGGYRNRFLREAKTLARLTSPYITTVYDAGEQDGWLFIATELIRGGDLKERLAADTLSVDEAARLVRQMAQGLELAHEHGILHRDIKPSNVLLRPTRTGEHDAVLCDLGIAATLGAEYTKTVGVTGTLGYMAPERHEGREATIAGDIYGLGCVMWACLTGDAPYRGTDMQVAMGHVSGEIPTLPGSGAQVAAINDFVHTAMAKDPSARFASAADVVAALEGVRAVPAEPVAPPVPEPVSPVVASGPQPDDFEPWDWTGMDVVEKPSKRIPTSATTVTVAPKPRGQEQAQASSWNTRRIFAVMVAIVLVSGGIGAAVALSQPGKSGPSASSTHSPTPASPSTTATSTRAKCWNDKAVSATGSAAIEKACGLPKATPAAYWMSPVPAKGCFDATTGVVCVATKKSYASSTDLGVSIGSASAGLATVRPLLAANESCDVLFGDVNVTVDTGSGPTLPPTVKIGTWSAGGGAAGDLYAFSNFYIGGTQIIATYSGTEHGPNGVGVSFCIPSSISGSARNARAQQILDLFKMRSRATLAGTPTG